MSDPTPEQALAAVLAENYPESVLYELGSEDPSVIASKALSKSSLAELAADPSTMSALSAALHVGEKRLGAMRRDAILAGYGDVCDGLATLIQSGLLVVAEAPGQREWTMTSLLETRQFLQREFTLPDEVFAVLAPKFNLDVEPPSLVFDNEQVKLIRRPSPMTLKLNLLHIAHGFREAPLSINRDGSGHRRVVNRLAADVSYASLTEAHTDELRTHYLHFLKAFLVAMGAAHVEERNLHLNVDVLRAHFNAPAEEQDLALLKAYKSCELWREAHAAALVDDKDSEYVDSLLAEPAGLGGLRGQVLADLGKLPLDGWLSLKAVEDLIMVLDRGYLTDAFNGEESQARAFVHALMRAALPWLGAAELGACGDSLAIRLTDRGRRMFHLPVAPPKHDFIPSFMIQPNFEITVFLDCVPSSALLTLYEVGERVGNVDRTSTFKLTPMSVQRGYSRGHDSEELITYLKKHARTGVPDSVAFTLRDWARLQQKVTLYACGTLLEYTDPDRLDMIVSSMKLHNQSGESIVSVGDEAVFSDGEFDALGKMVDIDALHCVDYAGPLAPCLEPQGGLVFREVYQGLDFVTEHELPKIADEGPARTWTLVPSRIEEMWGEEAASSLVAFMEPRVVGGLIAELELQLRGLVDDSTRARVLTGAVVLQAYSEEVCDALLEIPEVDQWVLERLGECALLVDPEGAERVQACIDRIGIAE